MKSQKQSVFDAIMVVKGCLTKDLSKSECIQVSEIVLSEIEDQTCRFDSFEKYNTLELRYSYVKGMVNNWLRKRVIRCSGKSRRAKAKSEVTAR